MQSLSSTLVSLQIPGGAHIYDLAGDHVDDVPAVRAARPGPSSVPFVFQSFAWPWCYGRYGRQRVLTMLRLWLGVPHTAELVV